MSVETLTKEKVEIKKPRMFRVIFHNDDVTPVAFVIKALIEFFSKSVDDAKSLTHEIHTTGSAVVGVYTKEIAETRVARTLSNAEDHDFPLEITIEPDE